MEPVLGPAKPDPWEDADDCDALRTDPLFKLAAGRAPEGTAARPAATTEGPMAKLTHINPDNVPDYLTYGLSYAVVAEGGKTVYLSGQVGWNENSESVGRTSRPSSRRRTRTSAACSPRPAGRWPTSSG